MRVALAVTVVLAGCASSEPAPAIAVSAAAPAVNVASAILPSPGLALANPGFEAQMGPDRRCAPGWDCIAHSNPEAFRFFTAAAAAPGERSLCVERVANEPWALVRQLVRSPRLPGARLRLSMDVRVDGASGEGAGPWILVETLPRVHAQNVSNVARGWQRRAAHISVPAGASELVVGAILLGPGRACIDNVRLEILASKATP